MKTIALSNAAPYLTHQVYFAYTPEQHTVWSELVGRVLPELEKHAAQEYLDGFQIVGLRKDRLPNLAAISARLAPRTGWSSTPVSGFLPASAFFEMLAARLFPTTTWLRSRESLEYTPEPDIFHDVFGHVPMHAHRVFADFLEHYGRVCGSITDAGVLEKLGRLFWYTVEFGVIRQHSEIKVYGSGLISSHPRLHSG
jgi:phenylalanine-4-hydroxylase